MANSETFAAQIVDNAMANAEEQRVPFWADMLEDIPALVATQGYQGLRGSNTILRGGWAAGTGPPKGGFLRGVGRNWLNPKSALRFSHKDVFSPTAKYTPFGVAAVGNWASRTFAARGAAESTRAGRALGRMGFQGWGGGGQAFTPGGYSRFSAVAKLGMMSDARYSRVAATSRSGMLGGAGGARAAATRGEAQRAILFGMGKTSVGGYMAGAASTFTAGGTSAAATMTTIQKEMGGQVGKHFMKGRGVAMRAGKQLGMEGAEYTARNIGKYGGRAVSAAAQAGKYGKAGMQVMRTAGLMAGRVGLMAIPGVNVAMAAWMVYDLAKIGTKLAGYGGRVAAEGIRSFQGGLNTGIMDQNFRDSEAAKTSRSRGVQAIQNSRLNARSVLGNEAGYMASHFG